MRGSPQGGSQSNTPLKRLPAARAVGIGGTARGGRLMSQGFQDCVDMLECDCGSTDLCIAYRTPVFAYVSDRKLVRVVVPDEQELVLGGVVRCLICDRFWMLDGKPDLGAWPRWELGR
jgi:hypothetical protein